MAVADRNHLAGIPALALFTDYPFDGRTSQDPGECRKHLARNARLTLTALDKRIRLAAIADRAF